MLKPFCICTLHSISILLMPSVYNASEHLPPPVDLQPTLSVNSNGVAYLSRALVQRLGLRGGQPIALRAPNTGSEYWHLDLRPRAECRIDWYQPRGEHVRPGNGTRPRIRGIKLPENLIAPGKLVVLKLMPGEPEFAGYYPLQPHAQPTQTAAPPLAA